MKYSKLSIILTLLFMNIPSFAQLTINIRYSGKNGAARGYVKEMEESGIAARIRAVEGCIRYDYFFPADDPEGLLLIDEWADQEALNRDYEHFVFLHDQCIEALKKAPKTVASMGIVRRPS